MFNVTMAIKDEIVGIAVTNGRLLEDGIALPGARELRNQLDVQISRAEQIIEAGIVKGEPNGVTA